MRNSYALTGRARKDLDDINDFIAEDNPQAANRFLDAFDRKCRNLAQFPEMGKRWNEINPPLRSFPLGQYLIFYRLTEQGVEVVRVLSGYRDIEAIFADLVEE